MKWLPRIRRFPDRIRDNPRPTSLGMEGATLPMARVGARCFRPVPRFGRLSPSPCAPPDLSVAGRRGAGVERKDMTALRRSIAQIHGIGTAAADSAGVFLRDVGQGP